MEHMKPFFSYFGSKYKLAKYYPDPIGDTIVEPFAGSACYSVRYNAKHVFLYDINPVICGVWDYLIHATEKDISNLPVEFNNVNDLNICQEAKWFIGFWLNFANARPSSKFAEVFKKAKREGNPHLNMWSDRVKQRIIKKICNIRHWRIANKSYEDVGNVKATWFIDPPYNNDRSKAYKYSAIDYNLLAEYCKTRKGASIVCENGNANWLNFRIFTTGISACNQYRGKELIWTQRNE